MSNTNENKITSCTFSGYGHYKVCISFYNKQYCAVTTNMPDLDKYRSKEKGWKQAGDNLYQEVKRKNDL